MYPPIYLVCMTDTSVQALLGDRLYPFGEALQDEVRPYAVWQVIYGAPENYLGSLPDADRFGTQIDVYAKTVSSAREVAAALFAALEPVAHVVSYNGEFREEVTRDYRYSFTVDFIKNR
jgi:hypothetical protein